MERNTIIVDIDGVLADYRRGLLEWVLENYPDYRSVCLHHLERSDTWIDEKAMGIDFSVWLDVLENFRMSGGKQSIPLSEGAVQMMSLFEQTGCYVVLLTSRPIDIYSTIYRDTIIWLRKNHIHHNLLLWSKDKAEMCYKLRLLGDQVLFAIDDEQKHINNYSKLGIKTYWLDHCKKSNLSNIPSKCTTVNSLVEIFEIQKEIL